MGICAICHGTYNFVDRWEEAGPDDANTCSDTCKQTFRHLPHDQQQVALEKVILLLEKQIKD